jgi:hypothetical protein
MAVKMAGKAGGRSSITGFAAIITNSTNSVISLLEVACLAWACIALKDPVAICGTSDTVGSGNSACST